MLTEEILIEDQISLAGSAQRSRLVRVAAPSTDMDRLFQTFLVAYTSSLAWVCWVKTMSFDELLSYYTAHASSVAQLITAQRNTPVSLDPPLVHILAHLALQLGLRPGFCVRLPSLCGAVLMIFCTYRFTARLTDKNVAALTIVTLLTIDHFHLAEARPYGVLLGLTALALLLWQNAIHGRQPKASAIGLFLTLGLAVSSHYFGILLIIPFVLAEVVRAVNRRRLDLWTALAVCGSLAFTAGWRPFLAGAHQYKANYYIKVGLEDLFRPYISSFSNILHAHTAAGDCFLSIIVLTLIALGAWIGYRRSRESGSGILPSRIAAEWTAIGALALLPLAGVALARLASGAFETRYVVEFTLGTTICLVSLLLAFVRRQTTHRLLLSAACVIAVTSTAVKAWQDATEYFALDALVPATVNGITILTNKQEFLWLQANPALSFDQRARILWVADMSREIKATQSDNIDRTMLNLKIMARLPVISYNDLLSHPGTYRLIVNDRTEPTSWLPAALSSSNIQIDPEDTFSHDNIGIRRATPLRGDCYKSSSVFSSPDLLHKKTRNSLTYGSSSMRNCSCARRITFLVLSRI